MLFNYNWRYQKTLNTNKIEKKLNIIKNKFKDSSEILKKFISGGFWAFLGKGTLQLVGIVFNTIIARLLSPDDIGEYFIVTSIIAVVGVFFSLGLPRASVRIISRFVAQGDNQKAHGSIIVILGIYFLASILAGLFLLFGGGTWLAEHVFKSEFLGNLSGLMAFWILNHNFQKLFAEIFRGFHKIKMASMLTGSGVINRIMQVIVLIIALILDYEVDLLNLIWLLIISQTAINIWAFSVLIKQLSKDKKPTKFLKFRQLFSITWPFWIRTLSVLSLNQGAFWILGSFHPPDETAVFGFAYKLSLLLFIPRQIINEFIAPIISELYTKKEIQRLEEIIRSISSIISIISIFVYIIIVFWGGEILTLFFGDFYRSGSTLLLVFSTGFFVNTLTGSNGLLLMMTGHQKQYARIFTIIGILSVIFQYIFVPNGGAMATAVIVSSTIVLDALFSMIYTYKQVGIRAWPGKLIIPKSILRKNRE